MVDSDSSLSSPPSTDNEMPIQAPTASAAKPSPQKKKKKKNGTILTFFKHRSPSPPPRKRSASPARDPVPEDNPNIAFIVMFRSRFNDAFPRGSLSVGPQDIEQGVAEEPPSADVEGLLCALLGLVLNRKKPVEKGHYGRALEEAIQTQKSQWPLEWTGSPLSGGRGFNTMSAEERITLLHTLALWSLNQNEQVKAMIANAYKSRTTKDKLDTNIPLSVQPWGRDGDRRRYWLVEGQNDTHFRIYRESDPKLKKVQWITVADSIDELRVLAKKLEEEDGHKEAKALGERMINAIPRFEMSEGKRKRREYRLQRNATFIRPDPGFSLYEGRTRGKRLRYTFTDEDDFDSEDVPSRRSGRQSARENSAAPSGPTVTASGRQVRSRATGLYGETLHSGQVTDRVSPATGDFVRSDVSEEPQHAHSRSTRAANRAPTNDRSLNRRIGSDDDEDATSWDGGDEDEDEPEQMELDDEEDDAVEESSEDEEEPQTLVVTLRYRKGSADPPSASPPSAPMSAVPIANGIHQPGYSMGAPLAGAGAPRQPEPAIIPAQLLPPTHLPALAPLPVATAVPNSLPIQSQQPSTTPLVPVAHQDVPVSNPDALPLLEGFFSAPTLPYSAPQEARKPELPTQYPAVIHEVHPQPQHQHQQPSLPTTLPSVTPASSWQ